MKKIALISCLLFACDLYAKPVVESRYGEPMTMNQAEERNEAGLLSLKQMDVLKEEIAELRGLLEKQEHELNKLKKSQQDYYIDLDKRIGALDHKTPEVVVEKMELKEEPPTPSTPQPVEKVSLTEQDLYAQAYAQMQDKAYKEALSSFQDYLVQFPQGTQVAQAHYWLGEIYIAEWQVARDKRLLEKATESFLVVTSRFPTHQKATDSLFKLGIVEQDKGNMDAAKRYFTEVKERYPDSSAARLAEAKLKG